MKVTTLKAEDAMNINLRKEVTELKQQVLDLFDQIHQNGYDEGHTDGVDDVGDKVIADNERAYTDGISDCWKVVTEIANMSERDRDRIFEGTVLLDNILTEYGFAECKKRMMHYNQDVHAAQFREGDEVKFVDDDNADLTYYIYKIHGVVCELINEFEVLPDVPLINLRLTGHHSNTVESMSGHIKELKS